MNIFALNNQNSYTNIISPNYQKSDNSFYRQLLPGIDQLYYVLSRKKDPVRPSVSYQEAKQLIILLFDVSMLLKSEFKEYIKK